MKKLLSVLCLTAVCFTSSACGQTYYNSEIYPANPVYPAPNINSCYNTRYMHYDTWGYPRYYNRTVCNDYRNNDISPYIIGGAVGLGLGILMFKHDYHDNHYDRRGFYYRH